MFNQSVRISQITQPIFTWMFKFFTLYREESTVLWARNAKRINTRCMLAVYFLNITPRSKGKAVPFQALCGPEGSMRFRLLDLHDIRHMKVERSSALRTNRLYLQECSWYSFSLGAEKTPRPWCDREEIYHWKIQWHHRESIPGPSDY